MHIEFRTVTCRESEALARFTARQLGIALRALADGINSVAIHVERLTTPGQAQRVVIHADLHLSHGMRLQLRTGASDHTRAIRDLFGRIAGIACANRIGAPRHRTDPAETG